MLKTGEFVRIEEVRGQIAEVKDTKLKVLAPGFLPLQSDL
jgi:hypothetical protein